MYATGKEHQFDSEHGKLMISGHIIPDAWVIQTAENSVLKDNHFVMQKYSQTIAIADFENNTAA